MQEGDEVDERKPGAPARVRTPTSLEKEDHYNSGHARYRNWCPHCVAAKGQGQAHKMSGGANPGEIPELGFDYFYLGDQQNTGLPNIAARDNATGSFAGSTLEQKGRNTYAKAYLVGWIRGLGYKRVVMRSDNEPSILALLREVAAELPEIECVMKSSPEGDHQQNGLAEVSVREVKGQARVLKSELEYNYQKRMAVDAPILTWMVRHAANAMCRGRIGSDGRTPEQRRTGRQWTRPTVLFGEQCFFKPTCGSAENRPRGGEMRMKKGIYVGHHERTGATLLLTPEGMRRGTGLTRLPIAERFDDKFLEECKGLPWDVKPRQRAAPAVVDVGVGEGVAPLPPPSAQRERNEVAARKRYITIAEIERYRGTDACAACTRMALGERGTRGAHSEECRARFAKLWAEDESDEAVAKREAESLRQGQADARIEKRLADGGQSGTPLAGSPAGGERDEQAQKRTRPAAPERDAPETGGSSASGLKRDPDGAVADQGWEELASRMKRARPVAPPELRGQKRDEPEDGHLDDDVELRNTAHEAREREPDLGAPDERIADEPADATMSASKLELVPAMRRILEATYRREGVDLTDDDANSLAQLLVACCACDVSEIYTPPRFTPKCNQAGLRPGFCVDLTTKKSDGQCWDLTQKGDIEELKRLQVEEEPYVLIGSPPCTTFCPLLRLKFSAQEIRERQKREGEPHVRTCITAYERQLAAGRHFLHEHPACSGSWGMPEVKALAADPRVFVVQGPMCRWGMQSCDREGAGFVRKETKWMTSSAELANVLGAVCSNATGGPWHRHVRLMGGNRAELAATYPPKLVKEVLQAIKVQMQKDGYELHSFAAGPHNDEPELPGGEWDDEYVDDIKGGALDADMVRAGRAEEIDWIMKQKVFMKVPIETARNENARINDMKWIDTKKGDKVRSRLVVREIKARKRADEKLDPATVFAAMPPVEGLKALISHMQTEQVNSKGEDLEMMVLDISRAHFYGEARRRVFTTLPEGYQESGQCALLLKTMYGTEDAASVWQDTWSDHVRSDGVRIGQASPALFMKEDLRGLCHGDDFVIVACRRDLLGFETHLKSKFATRRTGHLGFAEDCDTEVDILKRTVRVVRDKKVIELEADRRHVEMLLAAFKMEMCKPAATPRVKVDDVEVQRIAATPVLEKEHATLYRSCTMRAAYLAVDRPDISEAVKVLSQAMSAPREGHMGALKRLVRYLAGERRRVQVYQRQRPEDAHLEVLVDSDWAGDVGCRRSTTGMAIMRGKHLLRHSATLQASVGLSSAEAEYYALVRGACFGLGMQSYYADWNIELRLRIHSDSSSARAFAKRQGLGKQRHVMTRFLWIQERVRMKHFEIMCIDGKSNAADLMTKALTKSEIEMNCKRLQLENPRADGQAGQGGVEAGRPGGPADDGD